MNTKKSAGILLKILIVWAVLLTLVALLVLIEPVFRKKEWTHPPIDNSRATPVLIPDEEVIVFKINGEILSFRKSEINPRDIGEIR